MNLPVYNPCKHGIPAKVWELLRRNKAFKEKTKELNSFQGKEGRREKFLSVKEENNYFAGVAWNWMHEPVIIPPGRGSKEGQPQRLGPRIRKDQGEFLEAYEEDKRKDRAPLKLDSTWPNTPRGFQNAFKAKWADYTDVYEIVPSELYANENEIPPGIETAPALPHKDHSQAALKSCFSNMALYWHWTVKTNRLFAVPRVSLREKSSRDKIIKLITENWKRIPRHQKSSCLGQSRSGNLFLLLSTFAHLNLYHGELRLRKRLLG